MLHQITVEMCTGFLLLAGLSVAAKATSDAWTRRLSGRSRRLDRWASLVADFVEPASFVALLAGVGGAFLSMYTGSHAWPAEDLVASAAVHNKLLLVGLSQALFLSALVFRLRFRSRIWLAPTTGAFYALLVLAGDGIMVLQNSVGGHLAGSGSLLDDLLASVAVDPTAMWVLPSWAAVGILVVFPLATLHVGRKLRTSARASAQTDMRRLARDVKDLLVYARRANLAMDPTRARIAKANVAARRKDYARASKLMAQARKDLMAALSFTETAEGDWLYTGTAPIVDEPLGPTPAPAVAAPTAAPVAVPAAMGVETVEKSGPRGPAAPSRLATAVERVRSTEGRMNDDPVLTVQRQLHWARDAIHDLKILGRDLAGPIGALRAASEHARKEEWDDALEWLERLRREVEEARTPGSMAASSG